MSARIACHHEMCSSIAHVVPVAASLYGRGMDTIKRRSRMRRTRTGKRIELTNRDFEIFRTLARYRYLPSTHIHAFVGGASETRFKERLGDLFHEGYLDRPNQQWQFANARYAPAIHENGEGARLALREQGDSDLRSYIFLGPAAHRQFAHSLMICEILASIETGVRHQPNVRFIGWPEMLSRAPERARASVAPLCFSLPTGASVIPDGMFGLEYECGGTKTYRFFALEADRGTMPVSRSDGRQTSFLAKIAAYRDLLAHRVHKSSLGIPNLIILTVTTSDLRVNEIMRRMEGDGGANAPFLFKTAAPADLRLPAPWLLSEPWMRAGLPALGIDESGLTQGHIRP